MSDDERREVDGDELGEPGPDDVDVREGLVAAALDRFYGGDLAGGEREDGS